MFKIITQTSDFIVVNKEPDVNFHDEGNIGEGLFSQVKFHLLSESPCAELFPVHRLDKMTSGLIIFAKNLACAQEFNTLFKNHFVEKYYLAISDKKPKKKQGLIKGDMGKSRRGMFKLLRSQNNPAITQFFSYPLTEGRRLYLLKPHSGKTHQLRVALSSIAAPIYGDPLYYPKADCQKSKTPTANSPRGYLHAYAIRFQYKDKNYEIISPPTHGEFFLQNSAKEQLQVINKPWLLNWPKV